MRKGKSLVGMTVLGLEDGVRVETVSDVVIDPDGRRLIALVIDEGGFLSSSKVILVEDVTSFGKDAIVVKDGHSVVAVSDNPALRELVGRKDRLIGKKVYTVEGNAQGTISDIYFDEGTGTIVGYEVSGGLLGDLATGVSYLPTEDITNIGPDAIYVVPEAEDALDAQVGGLKGMVEGTGERVGSALSGAASGGAEGALVGKRTGSDVEAPDGSVLIPRGRRIRPEDVATAKQQDALPALTASVASAEAAKAGAAAKDAVGAAGDAVGSLWDQFTRKIGEMTDASGKRVDEEQTKRRLAEIADAIGRPVTKVVLDRGDDVVLNLGDIITHQAIQRAHEAGGLDSLLGSVYRGTVEFSRDEMRAPAEAQATVDKSSGGAPIVEQLERKVEDAQEEREAQNEQKRAEASAAREERERDRKAREQERATPTDDASLPTPESSSTGEPVAAPVSQVRAASSVTNQGPAETA